MARLALFPSRMIGGLEDQPAEVLVLGLKLSEEGRAGTPLGCHSHTRDRSGLETRCVSQRTRDKTRAPGPGLIHSLVRGREAETPDRRMGGRGVGGHGAGGGGRAARRGLPESLPRSVRT